jgi:hypothetical protein
VLQVVTDAHILAASREEPDRFRELFERHFSVTLSYLRRRVGIDMAEDLAIETFAVAFRRRASYDVEQPAPARGCSGSPPTSSTPPTGRTPKAAPRNRGTALVESRDATGAVRGASCHRVERRIIMRRLAVLVTAAVLIAGPAWAVTTSTNRGTTPVNCMDTTWHRTMVSTSSTTFTSVSGFTDDPTAVFPIAIDVSALVSGAPVQFRILSTNVGGQTRVSRPGATTFVPNGGNPDSFSYRWIELNQSAAVHAIQLRLQWRSPSGTPVNLLRGDMSVQYHSDGCPGMQ